MEPGEGGDRGHREDRPEPPAAASGGVDWPRPWLASACALRGARAGPAGRAWEGLGVLSQGPPPRCAARTSGISSPVGSCPGAWRA